MNTEGKRVRQRKRTTCQQQRASLALSSRRLALGAAITTILVPQEAFAYLDPGTGSMLVSALVGIVATIFFAIKGLWYRGIDGIYAMFGKKVRRASASIVFYSEGRQYWNVFRPVIEGLAALGEQCVYLTSDDEDPALACDIAGLTARCIGTGNRAFAVMNSLEADICVMTTPGLDVLQIRRSPGVKHYAHIVHMPGDTSLYRKFGLDYYDSLLASGPHQEASVRELEAKRHTQAKMILKSGCTYYDILLAQKKALPDVVRYDGCARILLAPTWGPDGLLNRYGTDLIIALAEAGYHVVVRPHPQSRIVEADLIERLQKATEHLHVTWDSSPDNFAALSSADVLISDWSNIIFDYAFVMERPVLVMDYTPDIRIYDAYDLDAPPWDFTAVSHIGRKVTLADIPHLTKIVNELLAQREFVQQLRAFRDGCIYNWGSAGTVTAKQLLELRASVCQESKED